jgi:hypothetical protein
MNLEQLQKKLLAAARADAPGDGVPYAFEKRIMARLAALPPHDNWAQWSRALWRAATPCVALALLLGVFHFANPPQPPSTAGAGNEEFWQHFEQTMLAVATESEETL